MYEFVDREVDDSNRAIQLFVWTVRQWTKAAQEGRCVCPIIGPVFEHAGISAAIEPFHRVMRAIAQNAIVPLWFGAVERPLITEHEAVLLAAADAAQRKDERVLRAIARGIIQPDMAAAFASSLLSFGSVWSSVDLRLSAAVHDDYRES